MPRPFTAILDEISDTHAERAKKYTVGQRHGHEVHAELLKVLFPDGVPEGSEHKFVLLNYIIGKLVRYSLLLPHGHQDSIHDIAVYAMILDSYHEKGD